MLKSIYGHYEKLLKKPFNYAIVEKESFFNNFMYCFYYDLEENKYIVINIDKIQKYIDNVLHSKELYNNRNLVNYFNYSVFTEDTFNKFKDYMLNNLGLEFFISEYEIIQNKKEYKIGVFTKKYDISNIISSFECLLSDFENEDLAVHYNDVLSKEEIIKLAELYNIKFNIYDIMNIFNIEYNELLIDLKETIYFNINKKHNRCDYLSCGFCN